MGFFGFEETMKRGYTKRWRKRWDKGYHRDFLLWILMDYFIDFANHKDTKVYFPGCGLIPVKRGQHIFGTPQLSVFLGIDRSLLRRKLKILETIEFSTIKTTNKYSILTVINYDTYQPLSHKCDQQNDTEPTSKRPANDQQTTTPNNVNNVKNVNNNTPHTPPNPKKKKFTPPTEGEVVAYFAENGYTPESARKAFLYYEDGDPPWHDSRGNAVKSWKQKMRGVWFKPENTKEGNSGKNRYQSRVDRNDAALEKARAELGITCEPDEAGQDYESIDVIGKVAETRLIE